MVSATARDAAIEVADVFDHQRYLRRTAVDHATDRNPMAFAEGRDAEPMAEVLWDMVCRNAA